MEENKKRKSRVWLKILLVIIIAGILSGSYLVYKYYNYIYAPNVNLVEQENTFIYIPTGSNYSDVLNLLYATQIITDPGSFEWLAQKKNYANNVKPGRYLVSNRMNNNDLINLLRSGKQVPVNVIFNNIRTKEQLAGRVAQQIEADSLSIINLLNNNAFLEKYGLNPTNILLMFLPNTYEFYWNTSAESFVERMNREYRNFWNEERVSKAASAGLSPEETGILASIVQAETTKRDEMSRMAGVYINRLKKGMLLQADPTVVYAWGDFGITRVLLRHLEIDSPYNTYKYAGLPPGPINLPEPSTIDRVLNYEKHDYIFFCAKDDFSGYHVFAKTHAQHINNARKYQQALNRMGIR